MRADLLSNFIGMTLQTTFLKANYPAAFTADEVADQLGVSFLSVRPRLSELRRSELIEPTAERRKNKSGMLARCWRAVLGDALNERAQ
jgi:predicted ArsR family transcriptional regulator